MRNPIDPLMHMGCLFAAIGIMLVGVMFWLPLILYSVSWWTARFTP